MELCLKKDKMLLIIVMLIGAVSAVGASLIALVLQRVVDIAMKGNERAFWQLLTVIIVYILVLCVIGFLEALCGKVLLKNVTKSLRTRIFKGVMNKRPMDYYKSNSADYLSAITNDVKMVEENYLIPLLLSSQMVALFLATLVLLCYLSLVVTVVLIGSLVLMFLVPVLFGKALQKRQDKYSGKMSEFTVRTKDFLSGYEVVRGFFIGSHIQKKFLKENNEAAQAKYSADRLLAVNESLANMLSTLSTVVVVFISAYMVLRGNITVGTLLALIQLSSTFSMPVLVIMQNFPKMAGMKPVLVRLASLCVCGQEDGDEKESGQKSFQKYLELEGVTFGYEEGQDVLKDVTLRFEAGKKYAILGDSGCGKTTLIKLMTGYSGEYKGSIRYDGKEVRDMKVSKFSGLVSVIHQNVYLFDTDIEQNISLDEVFSEEEWKYALEKSGVSKFMSELPDGINTDVGENGSRLSGGQRQRVAVARALIRKTPILILDEGTSAVDRQTAYRIERDLLEEKELTLIVITHHMQEELRDFYHEVICMTKAA